jgi:glutamyl-tRNA reductase
VAKDSSTVATLYNDYLMVGVHYTTAHLDIRESFNFQDHKVHDVIQKLTQSPEETGIRSLAVLTTCNRVELYALCTNPRHAELSIRHYFIEDKGIDPSILKSEAVITLHGEAVARHLYRVACGLDSLILGEGQILTQVKTALETAQEAHPIENPMSKRLKVLFYEAVNVGKKVRNKTGIASRDASVSKSTLDLALIHHPKLHTKPIVVVGGGKMACLILEHLNQHMPLECRHHVTIVNRSAERLAELEDRFSFKGVTWEDAPEKITQAEILFVATGAPHLLFFSEQFSHVKHPMSIYDISVPRNVCPEVAERYPHIQVFDTDALVGLSSFDPQKEARLRQTAEGLIEKALAHLPNCLNKIACKAELKHLRDFVESLHEEYLAQHTLNLDELKHLPESQWRESIEMWSRDFVQRLLHSPSTIINQGHFQVQDLSILRELFQPIPYSREPFSLTQTPTPASPPFDIHVMPYTPNTSHVLPSQEA